MRQLAYKDEQIELLKLSTPLRRFSFIPLKLIVSSVETNGFIH